jgi:hypothetical protein
MIDADIKAAMASKNEKSLATLLRIIEKFQGEFSLTFARCNDSELRFLLLEILEDLCQDSTLRNNSTIEYQELTLTPTASQLYRTIYDSTQKNPPPVLMVLGVESVIAIDDLVCGANRSRDQFKNLPFPLILWVTDTVLSKFTRLASDFNSWASVPINFVGLSDNDT